MRKRREGAVHDVKLMEHIIRIRVTCYCVFLFFVIRKYLIIKNTSKYASEHHIMRNFPFLFLLFVFVVGIFFRINRHWEALFNFSKVSGVIPLHLT